ncbi:hypothetical protein FOTG_02839 [Fusarium oxysporum f. sp. vasinfectum 25433]|uniref:Adenylosuccinate lyase C-terminal domain-containing protein n=1 Tax=Fusarium oxysporum f. sp. vasinfectum 25433 TaxID=1089449 RepID=X0MG42_FUSOX|nr:hypothetical protein FOTG_02839 [Fusarium oxysporum f. sp. vasinfectum 25433]
MTVLFELTCRRRPFSPMLSSTVWTMSLTGIVICPQVIATRVQEQLPFVCTESIVMKLVAKGVSRQVAHEQSAPYHIRVPVRVPLSSMTFLINRIKAEEFLRRSGLILIPSMLKPELYIGCRVEIVERYCGPEGTAEKKVQPYRSVFRSYQQRSSGNVSYEIPHYNINRHDEEAESQLTLIILTLLDSAL